MASESPAGQLCSYADSFTSICVMCGHGVSQELQPPALMWGCASLKKLLCMLLGVGGGPGG